MSGDRRNVQGHQGPPVQIDRALLQRQGQVAVSGQVGAGDPVPLAQLIGYSRFQVGAIKLQCN
jgi:hypothetical protein